MTYSNQKSEISFREIILAHLKKILEISNSELRDKTIVRNHGQYSETVENEDTRLSYIQSIENMSYALIPYFDKEMQKVYDECIEVITSFPYELKETFKEEIEEAKQKLNKEKIPLEYYTEIKIHYAKKLFIELNKLLKRNDYLKTAVYGEEQDEIAEE